MIAPLPSRAAPILDPLRYAALRPDAPSPSPIAPGKQSRRVAAGHRHKPVDLGLRRAAACHSFRGGRWVALPGADGRERAEFRTWHGTRPLAPLGTNGGGSRLRPA